VSAADSAEDKKLAAEQRVSLNASRELEAWMTRRGMWLDEIESGFGGFVDRRRARRGYCAVQHFSVGLAILHMTVFAWTLFAK
jgi:hypothetical protein